MTFTVLQNPIQGYCCLFQCTADVFVMGLCVTLIIPLSGGSRVGAVWDNCPPKRLWHPLEMAPLW